MGLRIDEASRRVLERLYLAHAIAEASREDNRYRLYPEDPVLFTLEESDRETLVWFMYHLLFGRSQAFWDWAEKVLGIGPEDRESWVREAWDRLRTPRLERFVALNMERGRLLQWPPGASAAAAEEGVHGAV